SRRRHTRLVSDWSSDVCSSDLGPANTVGAGASGLVFGYFGYIMVRGFFDRHVIDMVTGAIMALCFAYQFAVLLPHAGIGWQAHRSEERRVGKGGRCGGSGED